MTLREATGKTTKAKQKPRSSTDEKTRECTLCLRVMPMSSFPRRASGNAYGHRCTECHKGQDAQVHRLPDKMEPAAVLKMLDSQATSFSTYAEASQRDIMALLQKPCSLCPRDCHSVVPKDQNAPYVPKNLAGVCKKCRKLVLPQGYDELVAYALGVADRNGWTPDPFSDDGPPARKKKFYSKSEISNMHPSTSYRQHFGETFEQKLERYTTMRDNRVRARSMQIDKRKAYDQKPNGAGKRVCRPIDQKDDA